MYKEIDDIADMKNEIEQKLLQGFQMPSIKDVYSPTKQCNKQNQSLYTDVDIESLYPDSSGDEEEFEKKPTIITETELKKLKKRQQ